MDKCGKWLLCPLCNSKTRVWIREDTILRNFLLFCPKCKQERLINLKEFHMTLVPEPDAETQRRRDAEKNITGINSLMQNCKFQFMDNIRNFSTFLYMKKEG